MKKILKNKSFTSSPVKYATLISRGRLLHSLRAAKKNSVSQRTLQENKKNLCLSAPSASLNKTTLSASAPFAGCIKKPSASPRPLREVKKNLSIPAPSAGGFTLIEIVAIVIITAILAVVVLPRVFSGYSSVKVSTGIRQVADDIRYCREEAEATRDTCWILFDVANNRYTLYRHYPSGTILTNPVTQENFQVQLGQGSLDGLTLTAVSFLAPASNHLAFTPFGTPVGGGSITLNGSRVITIEPETGTLDIQ